MLPVGVLIGLGGKGFVLQVHKVLVAIPAYNEEDCIEATVRELRVVAPGFDFVVINDGSADSTLAICRRLQCDVLNMPVNCGLTVGFRAAVKYAYLHGYDCIIQFDADGQHKPEYLSQLVEKMEQTAADVVIGSRFLRYKKGSSMRMLGSRMITLSVKLTTGHRVSDPTSGFRLFGKRAIEQFMSDSSLNPEPETVALLLKRGLKIEEIQVEMRERQGGKSYLNFGKSVAYMARTLVSILFVQWFR